MKSMTELTFEITNDADTVIKTKAKIIPFSDFTEFSRNTMDRDKKKIIVSLLDPRVIRIQKANNNIKSLNKLLFKKNISKEA